VDEFQDVNPLDLALIKAITDRSRASLTIVGDDDQAIFEWRGATPEYILQPDAFFGVKFETHTLAVNYRSPANIVSRSQALIAHNSRRVLKDTRAYRQDEASIVIHKTRSINETLEHVYKFVQDHIGTGKSPSRVAIIGRKRGQIIPYQIFFASKDVSFCAAEDLQVFLSQAFERLLELLVIKQRADQRATRTQAIDDLLALCNLVKRYPLNKKDKDALRRHVQQHGGSTLATAVDALESYKGSLKGTNADGGASHAFADAIRTFLKVTSVSEALEALGHHFEGLHIDLGKAEDDIFFTDPPFAQLAEYASRYGDDYNSFLDDIERAKAQLAYIPPFEDDGQVLPADSLWKRPLHLMTALRAKGKEFDAVILLDVNDGVWPNRNARSPEQLEAERRVFYVAFTRAKSSVLIEVRSHIGNRQALPSPYIEELGLSL
jgi:DNA helicase-2/ATP-dependent DNA helicase PcrA